MKKIILYLVFIISVFVPTCVFAQTYEEKQLIPVDTVATVSTEKFEYQDFAFSSNIDEKGNTKVTFNSIQNKTRSKVPVTIDILMFDAEQKNIGIITYCSNKDVSSNYAGFQLSGDQASPFVINVVSTKYFVEGKAPKDVKYIAVLDDNKYCHIGGYDKYEGLTIDEISNGKTSSKNIDVSAILKIASMALVIIIIVILVSLIVQGIILNALYKRIYAKTTIFAYIPVTNFYITIQLAFGKIVATIILPIYLIGTALYLKGVSFIFYIVSFIQIVAFIIIIIKLITKKYDLFILEPSIKSNIPEVSDINDSYESDSSLSFDVNSDVSVNNNNYIASTDEEEKLDLSYDDASDDGEDAFSISTGNINNIDNSNNEKSEENSIGKGNDDEGGSDLSKFFQ